MFHTMNIAGLDRNLPICKVTDDLYIAGFVIFGDQELTVACAKALLEKAPEYDYIITAEAKGIPLAHEMARQTGAKKYFLARKAPKLYMQGVFSVSVKSITTAKEQTLYLDTADAELMKGKKILLVDDVISTGESLTHWKPWSRRPAAKLQAVWPFWLRGMPRSAPTSFTWKSCPCLTPTARSRLKIPQKGPLVQRGLSAEQTGGLTIPPALRATSLYTREAYSFG